MIFEEGRLAIGWVIPEGKTWIDLFQALLTPAIALAGVSLGILQYRLAKNKRNDDLFERRIQFIESVWSFILKYQSDIDPNAANLDYREYVLVRAGYGALLYKSKLLFDEEVEEFLSSQRLWERMPLPERSEEREFIPVPEWFYKPFERHLKISP